MTLPKIKKSAIPAAGYHYQTLQGISLLCDWLDAPSRYTRVRFECDDDAVSPQGLDDLVAERPDGVVDVWQVKFTPSSDKYFLSVDWLLETSGKGPKARSNLRKWYDAFNKIETTRLGEMRLLTNRIPDLELEGCLDENGLIDYSKASPENSRKLEAELGGAENAKRFFSKLQVTHSDKSFTSINTDVTSRLQRHGHLEGAEALKNRAISWAVLQNEPSPDGWISIATVRAILMATAPEPVPENFAVPEGYQVPDKEFHRSFLRSIGENTGQPIVLFGPPGRGKSTYLSRVCEVLQNKNVPFVRHHYYLSVNDRTVDRLTSRAVEESLKSQISRFHSEVPTASIDGLGHVLAKCATHYKKQNKPFVVIIDGLDHVWRSHGHDKRPLDEIFAQLLPTAPNLVLVVGTQPVADPELPASLLIAAPRDTWRELPPMSDDAVLSYLKRQVDAGRLRVNVHPQTMQDEIVAAATALRARTNGHPLHVIYATEELIHKNTALSRWAIDQLSGDLSHDARTYYRSLWHTLTASQQDALRLICAYPFFWPPRAFVDIADLAKNAQPDVSAVEHLLHSSAAGLKAFHESLIGFVAQTENYDSRIAALSHHVENWLEHIAPDSLRNNWLWLVQASLGRPDNLITGIQRDWMLARLDEGYPPEFLRLLLPDAEERAMSASRWADAYRLRHLKSRLDNGVSYQLTEVDAARLKSCTWRLAPSSGVIAEAIASRHETSILEVAALGRALFWRGDFSTARKCGQEAKQRHWGDSRYKTGRHSADLHREVVYLLESFSELSLLKSATSAQVKMLESLPPRGAQAVLGPLINRGDLAPLVALADALSDGPDKRRVVEAAIRTAALAQADLTAWSEFPSVGGYSMATCLAAIANIDTRLPTQPLDFNWREGSIEERKDSLERLAHEWFFKTAALVLTTQGDFVWLDAPGTSESGSIAAYLEHLAHFAIKAAKKWRQGDYVEFHELFTHFEELRFPDFRNYQQGQAARDFRGALLQIAVDCHLLSSRNGGPNELGADILHRAEQCTWFSADDLRQSYVSDYVKLLTDAAALQFVENQMAQFAAELNHETGTRMLATLDLCEFALRHGLDDIARKLCRVTWDLAMGYGPRKDSTLTDTLSAIEYLVPAEPDVSRHLLCKLAPQIHHILDYTDGKGTRHVIAQTDALLSQLNSLALVEKYKTHVDLGDWWSAENTFKEFVRTREKSSAMLQALLRLGTSADTTAMIRERAATGDELALDLLQNVETHAGLDVGTVGQEQRYESPKTEFPAFPGAAADFPPSALSTLLEQLRASGRYGHDEFLLAWYQHWEAMGKASELISALEPLLLSDACRDDGLHCLLDSAFQTKKRLSGARAAFAYLVQAQIQNGGWLGGMIERAERSEARLAIVAKTYPKRADEFVVNSCYSWFSRKEKARIVPGELMVFLLVKLGRVAEAVNLAEEMVHCVQGDTRTLPLTKPNWADKLV